MPAKSRLSREGSPRLAPTLKPSPHFPRTPVAVAVSCLLAQAAVQAAPEPEPEDESLQEVTVTATRREESVQNVPLNITAIGGSELANQGIAGLADIGRNVPGLYVVDQGGRSANRIIVRGLNATSVSSAEGIANDGGGTVATYVGEIPLYVDLRPVDIDRVEILFGPQGTLYGSGTLGGAIRYIPNRPRFDKASLTLRGDAYSLSESDSLGGRGGLTVNVPLADTLAFRASAEYLDDPGFIDYNFVVRQPGVSNPQPDLSDPAAVAANLRRVKDANDEKTKFGRAALRWQPNDVIDATLSYFYQDMDVGARDVEQQEAFNTGKYESAQRVLEPNDRKNQLAALEVTADLGFAELTSATGVSRYREGGQRDQTDLLISLGYSYETFPAFTAFTREDQSDRTFNQEFRLVSKPSGPFSWIGGLFYNRLKSDQYSKEFTPGYSEYLVDIGVGAQVRPDSLEYYSVQFVDQKEYAVYGELTYAFTDAWQATVGGRWYKYDLSVDQATDLPLLESTILDSRGPNDVILNFTNSGQKDDGTLFKFNSSYHFTDDVMGYLTVSEGYRIGNSNGVAACEGTGENQNVCAQPDELQYLPDKTTNYEVGLRTQWLDRRITLNGDVYYIKWKDPQLASSTLVGLQPITKNGKGAETRGFELALSAQPTEAFGLEVGYGYTKAELSDDAPRLLRTFGDGFGAASTINVDGLSGDRLPGSPEKQGTFHMKYAFPLANGWNLDMNYGFAAIGNVLTRTGVRANGERLPGYTVHQAWATLKAAQWSLALYADNLTNKFARTGVRGDTSYLQSVTDDNGDTRLVRTYYHDVLRPRQVGLRFTYDFSFQ